MPARQCDGTNSLSKTTLRRLSIDAGLSTGLSRPAKRRHERIAWRVSSRAAVASVSPLANVWAIKALPVMASSFAAWWASKNAVDWYAARRPCKAAASDVGLTAKPKAVARAARFAASQAAMRGMWPEAAPRCSSAMSQIALIAPCLRIARHPGRVGQHFGHPGVDDGAGNIAVPTVCHASSSVSRLFCGDR